MTIVPHIYELKACTRLNLERERELQLLRPQVLQDQPEKLKLINRSYRVLSIQRWELYTCWSLAPRRQELRPRQGLDTSYNNSSTAPDYKQSFFSNFVMGLYQGDAPQNQTRY